MTKDLLKNNDNYSFLLKNKKELNIEVEKLKLEELNWGNDTSYTNEFLYKNRKSFTFFYGEFSMRLHCFFNLQKIIQNDYITFMDMLGGLGCTGKIYEKDITNTFLNDLDDGCINILKQNFTPNNITQYDSFNYPFNGKKYDVILSDFNNLTVFKAKNVYSSFLNGMFENSNKYVIITDCSNFHLRYGNKSYINYSKILGDFNYDLDSFFNKVKEYYKSLYPEWEMINVEYFNSSAYFLFEKTSQSKTLNINYNSREDMMKDRPIILKKGEIIINPK